MVPKRHSVLGLFGQFTCIQEWKKLEGM